MPTALPEDDAALPEDDVEPELEAEQAHLAEARQALARMRERTAALEAASGDKVSGEYLKIALLERMRALEDDPEVPLFFGRLDEPGESFHVGRRHVTDDSGRPIVVDWRAPVSRPFYRASRADPLGVERRRRFGFQAGRLTSYEDELLSGAAAAGESAEQPSAILEAEIERPRVGPMRDIVATIQPEQDDIVRANLDVSVCVQGAPGTGKTAVGLHRAAYLLYAHREQLRRQGILVVGPNESFLRYIGDVLPALGEIDARQTTLESLVAAQPIRGSDSAEVANVKGDARMAEVLHHAVWSHLRPATDALVVPRGARRWRVPAYEVDEIVQELRTRGVRYGAGRALAGQRLAAAVLQRMERAGESPDDRVHTAVARSRPVKDLVDFLWPAVDPERLVLRLLSEPAFLASAADGILTTHEQAALAEATPARGVRSARWSLHDLVLADEARDLVERTPSLGHVVLDEAQDLSPMMLRAVGRRCSTGSATVLGDLAQATTSYGTPSWQQALSHLAQTDAAIEELTVGFRVPGTVLDYATRLLPVIAPTLTRPRSVRRSRGELVIRADDDPMRSAAAEVAAVADRPGSVGLIVPDAQVPQAHRRLAEVGVQHSQLGAADDISARVDVVAASLAKGLEFDAVVLVEPADVAGQATDELTGLRLLYVCLTRAVMSLVIVHAKPIPVPAAPGSAA